MRPCIRIFALSDTVLLHMRSTLRGARHQPCRATRLRVMTDGTCELFLILCLSLRNFHSFGNSPFSILNYPFGTSKNRRTPYSVPLFCLIYTAFSAFCKSVEIYSLLVVTGAVIGHTRAGRNQLADDYVLLQAHQRIDLALDRSVGQHAGGLLEGCSGHPGIGCEGCLGDLSLIHI